jgi:hypothetical protein
MWIFATTGFYSAVSPRTEEGRGSEIETDKIMVRARVRSHLEALQARFPALSEAELIVTSHADYHFRIIVDKSAWMDAVAVMISDQEYTNFKNAAAEVQGVDGGGYVSSLHQVWSIMHRLQQRNVEFQG